MLFFTLLFSYVVLKYIHTYVYFYNNLKICYIEICRMSIDDTSTASTKSYSLTRFTHWLTQTHKQIYNSLIRCTSCVSEKSYDYVSKSVKWQMKKKIIIITEWNKNTYILYTCIYICVYSIVRDRTQLCLCRTARLYKCNWGRPVDSLQIIHTRFPFADFNVLACIKYIICTYLYICTCKQRVEVVACGGCCECDHEQSSNVIAKVCACV